MLYFSSNMLLQALLFFTVVCFAQADDSLDFSGYPIVNKRTENESIVLAVSNLLYDVEKNELYEKNLQTILTDYSTAENLGIDFNKPERVVKNHFGKFAIEYRLKSNCDEARKFTKGAEHSSLLDYFVTECPATKENAPYKADLENKSEL